ncbi:MAG: S8 family serine peptidase [Bacteroidales bacterium]|nr:S8 family serine peptidase [Bacteroidales bacterium]
MSKIIKIGILDSGVSIKHPRFLNREIFGYSLINRKEKNRIEKKIDFDDESGHGTAVYEIISSNTINTSITNIKIFNNSLIVQEEDLIGFLDYIYKNEKFDILNLSLGINICENKIKLLEVCRKIISKGTIIISAFDNLGSLSYPASFKEVIGVDTGENCKKADDYEFVDDDIVNIRAKGGLQRLAWTNPEYIVAAGNSFAGAYASSIVSNLLEKGIRKVNIREALKKEARKIYNKVENKPIEKKLFHISNAAVFPINKEMHALIRFEKYLNFNIKKFYDTKYSGKVGAQICKVINNPPDNINNSIIENIDKIDWDCFETLIIGHTQELQSITNNKVNVEDLILLGISKGKRVFTFDENKKIFEKISGINQQLLYWPGMQIEYNIPRNRFGKLFRINTPVLGVFGTKSKQGKFTLQLEIKYRLIHEGYSVGHLGTEPTTELFGGEKVFPSGYNSKININIGEEILLINSYLQEICDSNKDIIIVGGQSSTVPIDKGNLSMFTNKHIDFLSIVNPDAVILCINYYDSNDYIKKSMMTIEGITDAKIIALVMFPQKLVDGWSGIFKSRTNIEEHEFQKRKEEIQIEINKKVYLMGVDKTIDELFKDIIEFFSN